MEKKEEKALRKLISKIRPLKTGDQVLFLEDMSFYNEKGDKIVVKKGTKGYVFLKNPKILILHIYEKRYRGLIFELYKDNWDKLLVIGRGEEDE